MHVKRKRSKVKSSIETLLLKIDPSDYSENHTPEQLYINTCVQKHGIKVHFNF